MRSLSIPKLIVRRLATDWRLLLSVFLGIFLAIAILSGAPVYLKSLETLSFKTTIDRASSLILNIYTSYDHIPLENHKIRNIEDSVDAAISRNISDIYKGHERYIRTDDALLNPSQTIYEPIIALVQTMNGDSPLAEDEVSLGYFMNLWDLQRQVKFIHGRMASDMVSRDHLGRAEIEAIVGASVANTFDLGLGDMLTFDSVQGVSMRAVVRIVGIVEPIDSTDEYWQGRSVLFFEPSAIENTADLSAEVDLHKTPLALMITPEVARKLPRNLAKPVGYISSRGYFVHLSGLEQHVDFLQGRMASDNIIDGPRGPIVEAVVGVPIVHTYKIDLGDVITITPFIDENTWISARIVGIVERVDLNHDYWQWGPNLFFDPPFEESGGIPPLPLFVTKETMVRDVGGSYPGIQAMATWAISVDKVGLKEWSTSHARRSLSDLDNELARTLPGHQMFTGIRGLLANLERKSFLASIPVILLLTTMLVTVIYFLSMMVSYLIQHRQRDVELFKTRGIRGIQIFKFYALEGFALTVPACVLAPFFSMGVISVAGKLHYFDSITDGGLLPVEIRLVPFLVAICAGLMCFLIFVVPSVLSSRTGLIVHKLRSSRPPSEPFFQRYYLDVGLLVLGGLIFFELHSRGQLVVGGLFKEVQINETLMLAPVLLLIVVALLFMRFFPLVLRFFSGESSGLLHLLMIATVVGLGLSISVEHVPSEKGLTWLASGAILGAFAGIYWITTVVKQLPFRFSGLVVQAGLAVAIFAIERPFPGEVTFVVIGVLISLIPAQALFFLLKASAPKAPAWVSMALWNMARNPLQYVWLVLLLVLTAGLATFSTTVGTTLDKKNHDRIMYDVPSDIRITGLNDYSAGWSLKERYGNIAGVTSVSSAYRGKAQGPPTLRSDYKFLALESQDFSSISWYRDDFSELSLNGVMEQLRPGVQSKPLYIPDGATRIGVWAKLPQLFAKVKIKMLLQDGLGNIHIITLGDLESQKWTMLSTDVPSDLKTPLHLVSVQFNPTSSWIGIPGSVILDNIHVTVGSGLDAKEYIMDDFEQEKNWMAIPTSMIISDSVFSITADAYEGKKAATYTFGGRSEVRFFGDNRADVFGIYKSPNGGPLPVVASSSFMEDSDIDIGAAFILKVENNTIPVVIKNKVEYFPTMDLKDRKFVLADLDLFLAHLNILTLERIFEPNEFFIDLALSVDKEVSQEVQKITPSYGRMLDRKVIQEAELASISFDPLVTVGWRAMSILCLGVVLLIAVIGYATYLLFFADRNRGEMVLLRSLGFAHGQMIGLLILEHLIIVLMGLALGIWAGFQMSILTIPTLSMTDGSGSTGPPILVTVDWKILTITYLALVTAFASMLFILKKNIFRLDLQSISRV